jgi:hypothetical protein
LAWGREAYYDYTTKEVSMFKIGQKVKLRRGAPTCFGTRRDKIYKVRDVHMVGAIRIGVYSTPTWEWWFDANSFVLVRGDWDNEEEI